MMVNFKKASLRKLIFTFVISIQLMIFLPLFFLGRGFIREEIREQYKLLMYQTEYSITSTIELLNKSLNAIRSQYVNEMTYLLEDFKDFPYLNKDQILQKISYYQIKYGKSFNLRVLDTITRTFTFSPFIEELNKVVPVNFPIEKPIDKITYLNSPLITVPILDHRSGKFTIFAAKKLENQNKIIIISTKPNSLKKALKNLDFKETLETIQSFNPFLIGLNIYDHHGKKLGFPSYHPKGRLIERIDSICKQRNFITEVVFDKGLEKRYLLVQNDQTEEHDFKQSLIVELVFNNKMYKSQLAEKMKGFFIVTLLFFLLSLALTRIFINLLLRPFEDLILDISNAAKGLGELQVISSPPIWPKEIRSLQSSVNNFLITIQKNLSEIKSLTRDVINEQEIERQRIAQELHDSVGQNLVAGKIKLQLGLKENPVNIDLIKNGIDLIDYCGEELREIYNGLYPSILNVLGLEKTIGWYSRQVFPPNYEIIIRTQLNDSIDEKISISLFRIIQEIFSNIIKHAQANKIVFDLIQDESFIYLTVSDNGIGINKRKNKEEKNSLTGFGLRNIKLRLEEIHGKMELKVSSLGGLMTEIEIPTVNQKEKVDGNKPSCIN